MDSCQQDVHFCKRRTDCERSTYDHIPCTVLLVLREKQSPAIVV